MNNKYIVKRTFAKNAGLAYAGDVLENIPEPYLTDYINLGLIEPYDASKENQLPEFISTGGAMQRVSDKPTPKVTGGKPKNTKRK